MDELERQVGGMQIIAKSKLKTVADWRQEKLHWFTALKQGKLRPNDKQFIFSMLGSFIFWVLFSITNMATSQDAQTGLVYSIPFLYIMVCILIATAVIYQSRTF
jgi:hypothetical protein